MALFHLFCFLLCTTNRLKIRILIINLFQLYVHDISTKTYDPLSFVFFFLGSSTISSFHFHRTVRPKYVVLYHLFFLLCATIQPRVRVLTDSFLLFVQDHSTKIYGPLSLNLYFVHDHSTKN